MQNKIATELILALCLIAPLTASAGDWDTQDTALQALVLASLAIDRHQSNQAVDTEIPEIGWARTFIGSHPTRSQHNRYFAIAAAAHTLIAIVAPKQWSVAGIDVPARTIWQTFWFGVEVGTIHSNYYQVGLSIGFQ